METKENQRCRQNAHYEELLHETTEELSKEESSTIHALTPELLRKMNAYWRAANYVSVGRSIYMTTVAQGTAQAIARQAAVVSHWARRRPELHLRASESAIKKYDLNMFYIAGPDMAPSHRWQRIS